MKCICWSLLWLPFSCPLCSLSLYKILFSFLLYHLLKFIFAFFQLSLNYFSVCLELLFLPTLSPSFLILSQNSLYSDYSFHHSHLETAVTVASLCISTYLLPQTYLLRVTWFRCSVPSVPHPLFSTIKVLLLPSPAAASITRAEQSLLNIEQQREGETGERLSARNRVKGKKG